MLVRLLFGLLRLPCASAVLLGRTPLMSVLRKTTARRERLVLTEERSLAPQISVSVVLYRPDREART